MDLIEVNIKVNEILLLTCNNISLEPYASTSSRKFTFTNVEKNIELFTLLAKQKINLSQEDIQIFVNLFTNYSVWEPTYEFKIRILDYNYHEHNGWWVSGFIHDDYFDEYKQGIIDVFKLWQSQKRLDWFSLPLLSPFKKDYQLACLKYSGMSSIIVKRNVYKVDWSLVYEESDFIYLCSLAFIGEKGYFGYDFRTFEDCLLEIYTKSKLQLVGTRIEFNSVSKVQNNNMEEVYKEAKIIVAKFGLLLEESM